MNKTLALLMATAAMSMVSAAYAEEEKAQTKSNVKYKDNGGYESSVSSNQTDVDGTAKASKVDVDVDQDSKGHIKKKVVAKSTTDPKGLMNKKTETTKTELKEKDNGGYKETTTTKHTDAKGTNVTEQSKVDVDVDAEGNVEKNATNEKIVDPKGLGNKTKTVSKSKSVNGEVVESTKKSDLNTSR